MIVLLLLFICIASCCCQSNKTIYEALETYSPILHTHLQSLATMTATINTNTDTMIEVLDILDQTQYNVTFLLPIESVLNTSFESGLLNLSLPSTYNKLSAMILNGSFTNQMFSSNRQFYSTFLANSISIGPEIVNNNKTSTIGVYSGMTKAITTATEIQCINGIIQYIDHFLQPAETPLDTISALSETEYMEGLLKSLNISDIISGINKTILIPVNEAWDAINGSTLPYGTLVHDLKYSVIDGIYTLNDIFDLMVTSNNTTTVTLLSDYQKKPIEFQLVNQKLMINDHIQLNKTDILTSYGVIHLIDTVLAADTLEKENKTQLPVSGKDLSPLNRKSNSATTTIKTCILKNKFLPVIILPMVLLL